MDQDSLARFLVISSAKHDHLCPRQVLGVRMALAAARKLSLEVPRRDKRLLVIVETDGCFVDGIEAVTGATVGHRTLRVEDYGKVAATFIDVGNSTAVRISPGADIRNKASLFSPDEQQVYSAQLKAYKIMPDHILLTIQPVQTSTSLEKIISHPGLRAICTRCGEEIINEREVVSGDRVLCRSCADAGYYKAIERM